MQGQREFRRQSLHHTQGTNASHCRAATSIDPWVVVVVGLQESHLLWYGLELGSDPPSPLWYHRSVVGVDNGHRFSAEETVLFGCRAVWVTDVAASSVRCFALSPCYLSMCNCVLLLAVKE